MTISFRSVEKKEIFKTFEFFPGPQVTFAKEII